MAQNKLRCYGCEQQGDQIVGYFREVAPDGSAKHEFSVSTPAYGDDGKPIATEAVEPALQDAVRKYYAKRQGGSVKLPTVQPDKDIEL